MEKRSIPAALREGLIGLAMVMDGWMQSSAVRSTHGDYLSRCQRNDGLDGIVERAFIFDEGCWLIPID